MVIYPIYVKAHTWVRLNILTSVDIKKSLSGLKQVEIRDEKNKLTNP